VSTEEIPPDVVRLIADHLESVVQVEVLLLLVANPAKRFGAAEIGRELRVDPHWAGSQLAELAGRGMLEGNADPDPLYRYAPRSAELGRAIDGLARAYADRRVSVIGMIYSKPAKPKDPISTFADAFKLRKDKNDG
jgi:hypothetical protein